MVFNGNCLSNYFIVEDVNMGVSGTTPIMGLLRSLILKRKYFSNKKWRFFEIEKVNFAATFSYSSEDLHYALEMISERFKPISLLIKKFLAFLKK